MRFAQCGECRASVGWVGVWSNLLLMLLKGFVGVSTGSKALLADALYSLKDVSTSIVILVGLKISMKPLDKEHPYGHGKVEYIASAIISFVFVLITLALFFMSVRGLMGSHGGPLHMVAFAMAVTSVAANIFLTRYFVCVGREINSPIVRTLAKHSSADAISSGLVAIGILSTRFGFYFMDPLVAVLETVHLTYVGLEIFNNSLQGLLDASIPEGKVKDVKKLSLKVDGVKGVNNIRSRQSGQHIYLDLEVLLKPSLTIHDAWKVVRNVEGKLFKNIENLGDVKVRFRGM